MSMGNKDVINNALSKPWTDITEDMENTNRNTTENPSKAKQHISGKDERVIQGTEKMDTQPGDQKFQLGSVPFSKDKSARTQTFARRQKDEGNRLKGATRHQRGSKETQNQKLEREKEIELLQSKVTRLSNLLEKETGKKKSVLADLQKERDWTKKLGHDLQKYKDSFKLSGKVGLVKEDRDNTDTESVKLSAKHLKSKDKDTLIVQLQKEQTMRQQLEEELQRCKDFLLQETESSESGTEVLHQNFKDLEKNRSGLNKLKTEPKHLKDLKAQIVELASRLETETRMNDSLSKDRQSLSTELQKCKDALLERSEAPDSNTMKENLCQRIKKLEKEKFELNNKLKVEQEVNQTLHREAESLFARVQTEEKKNGDLERWMKSESVKLQKERRQRLELDLQLDKQAVTHKRELDTLKESSTELDVLHQEVEGLKATILKLSTKLELEEELSESLLILNERLFSSLETETKKLEKEQSWRLKLSDNLQKQKDAHHQELEALSEELEKLKVDNTEILEQLQVEKEAGHKKSHTFFGRRKKTKETQAEDLVSMTSTTMSQRAGD
ncbi:sporulation-specific protein 15-like [Cynoglossus semilaevis]|uniref:sporulation-specific protein 15-like n=1 Tax=Cynoglossus semilaevis TaxID=244447 RepID=UPI00049804D5|nr:sporulation-specific protein 15-like [Cynoglossus semilaevis]